MDKNKQLITTEKLTKTFEKTVAVKDVSFSLKSGEVRGLVGENGSGKSTLASLIAGINMPDSGKMFKETERYSPSTMLAANKAGISIVIQDVGTIEGLSVAENIFLGKESQFSEQGILRREDMKEQAKKLLREFQIEHIAPEQSVEEISFEDRKLLELVRALLPDPDLLILDETTSALSQEGRSTLFKTIEDLKESGKSVLFISHDLPEVIETVDKVTVLKDGEKVSTLSEENIAEDKIKELMVGRDLEDQYYRAEQKPTAKQEVVLRAENLSLADSFQNISLDLHQEEILGIGGLTNSGMHDLGEVLFGLKQPTSGTLELIMDKEKISYSSHQTAIRSGVGYVPKDRDREGLMLLSNIRDNIALSSLHELQKKLFISPKSEKRLAQRGAEQLDVQMSSINQLCTFLSGGNRQKVALAKWLVKDPKILILDCPTRGIDVAVKSSIYSLMSDLKREGVSIIMISEELPELIGMADRIMILKNGESQKVFTRREDLTEEEIIHHMV